MHTAEEIIADMKAESNRLKRCIAFMTLRHPAEALAAADKLESMATIYEHGGLLTKVETHDGRTTGREVYISVSPPGCGQYGFGSSGWMATLVGWNFDLLPIATFHSHKEAKHEATWLAEQLGFQVVDDCDATMYGDRPDGPEGLPTSHERYKDITDANEHA